MAEFAVYSGDLLVGHSDLEQGDAPMGVAFGVFKPLDAYAEIREICVENHADQSALELSVRTEAGAVIPCAGVGILDCPAAGEASYIEVNILGIPYPLYEKLFPQHVASYEKRTS
jgi:hypothetical protein